MTFTSIVLSFSVYSSSSKLLLKITKTHSHYRQVELDAVCGFGFIKYLAAIMGLLIKTDH